jgi:hypothetical protein
LGTKGRLAHWRYPFSYDLKVTDAAGLPVTLTPKGERLLRAEAGQGSIAHVTLEPAKADTTTVNLAELFDLKVPGKYHITAARKYFPSEVGGAVDVSVE